MTTLALPSVRARQFSRRRATLAEGAVAFQSVGTLKSSATTVHTFVAPAGIVDGDLLVVLMRGMSAVQAQPGGWQPIPTPPTTAAFLGTAWWKRALGESGNYVWNTPTSLTVEGQVYRISGANADDPFVVGAMGTGTGTTATAPAVVAPTDASLLLGYVETSGTRDFASGTMTEDADGSNIGLYHEALSAAGSTGTRAFTISTSATWSAYLIAVKD